jgi:hypothetical protein
MCKYRFWGRMERTDSEDSETCIFYSTRDKNFRITEGNSPLDILEIFFSTELLKIYRMKQTDMQHSK